MFEIDCSGLPKQVTDFSFDHLRDDVPSDITENMELNYNEQRVRVDKGDFKSVSEVKEEIVK